jgi:hypothetical protein
MRWAEHVACIRNGKKVYTVLVEKPEGKRPLRRPRLRWKDNIRLDIRETGWGGVGGGGMDSPGSRQGQFVGCCECGDEYSGSGVTDLVTKSKGSLLYSRKPATGPLFEPDESVPHLHPLFLYDQY